MPVAADNCRVASTVNVAARIARANNLMARIVVPKKVLIYMLFFEENIFHKSLIAKWMEALFRLHKIIFGGKDGHMSTSCSPLILHDAFNAE